MPNHNNNNNNNNNNNQLTVENLKADLLKLLECFAETVRVPEQRQEVGCNMQAEIMDQVKNLIERLNNHHLDDSMLKQIINDTQKLISGEKAWCDNIESTKKMVYLKNGTSYIGSEPETPKKFDAIQYTSAIELLNNEINMVKLGFKKLNLSFLTSARDLLTEFKPQLEKIRTDFNAYYSSIETNTLSSVEKRLEVKSSDTTYEAIAKEVRLHLNPIRAKIKLLEDKQKQVISTRKDRDGNDDQIDVPVYDTLSEKEESELQMLKAAESKLIRMQNRIKAQQQIIETDKATYTPVFSSIHLDESTKKTGTDKNLVPQTLKDSLNQLYWKCYHNMNEDNGIKKLFKYSHQDFFLTRTYNIIHQTKDFSTLKSMLEKAQTNYQDNSSKITDKKGCTFINNFFKAAFNAIAEDPHYQASLYHEKAEQLTMKIYELSPKNIPENVLQAGLDDLKTKAKAKIIKIKKEQTDLFYKEGKAPHEYKELVASRNKIDALLSEFLFENAKDITTVLNLLLVIANDLAQYPNVQTKLFNYVELVTENLLASGIQATINDQVRVTRTLEIPNNVAQNISRHGVNQGAREEGRTKKQEAGKKLDNSGSAQDFQNRL